MNEIIPPLNNNEKIVTEKGKPGKYLREKNNNSGLHSNNICDYVNISTRERIRAVFVQTVLKIPLGGIQWEKLAESLQDKINSSCCFLWTNRFFLIATNIILVGDNFHSSLLFSISKDIQTEWTVSILRFWFCDALYSTEQEIKS